MVANLSFAAALLQSLHLLRIRSAVAQSPIDRDQLGMGNRYDRTLTSAAEFQFLVAHLEKGLCLCCSGPCRLRADFLPQGAAAAIARALKAGQVYIEKMTTTRDDGRAIPVPSGLSHHWSGSIF